MANKDEEKKDDGKKGRRKHGAIFWLFMTIITGVIAGVSIGAVAALAQFGMYDNDDTFRKNINDRLLKNYAVYALSDYNDDFNLDRLQNTNFKYAVYSTNDPSSVNLERESSYEVCTLPRDVLKGDKGDLFKYSATLGQYSYFEYDIENLPGSYAYITNYASYNDSNIISEEHTISGFIYAWNTDCAYAITYDGYYFPVTLSMDMSGMFAVYRGQDFSMFNDAYTDWAEDVKELCNMYIYNDNGDCIDIVPEDIKVCKADELSNYVSGAKNTFESWKIDFESWVISTEKISDEIVTGKDCYLIACVAEPLNMESNDLFTRMDPWINRACQWKYLPVVSGVFFGIITLICLGYFLIRFFAFLRKGWKYLKYQWRENVGLLWRAILVCIVCTGAEFLVLVFAYNEAEELIIIGWIIQTLILIPVFIIAVLQLNKIVKGTQRLANGELHTPVDTKNMFYDFKKIGDGINSSSIGLERALEGRMKSERFKTELISNVSHDIKTPLTSIISYVELLREQPEDEPANREYLGTLERQAIKLKKLLEDLIEASKAQTGNLKAELTPCNVNMVLHQVIGEYEERLASQELILKIHVPEEPVNIMADTKHLQRVLDNLLVNAAKYSQPGTRVYINLTGGTDNAAIEIKNTSREPLNLTSDELLERFTRGDSSRGSEGNGLGLSIAQSLMELMNGKLNLVVDGDLFKVILLFPRVTDIPENNNP